MSSDEMNRLETLIMRFLNSHPEANDQLPEIKIELKKVIRKLQADLENIVSNEAEIGIDKLTAMLRDEDDDEG